MEQNENTLSVLKIAPGQYPQQVEIDNDLKALQQAVGGSIGASYPFADDPVAIVYADDGKLMGLPLNRALRDENGEMYDAVAGTFLVVGLGEEDFASLTPMQTTPKTRAILRFRPRTSRRTPARRITQKNNFMAAFAALHTKKRDAIKIAPHSNIKTN